MVDAEPKSRVQHGNTMMATKWNRIVIRKIKIKINILKMKFRYLNGSFAITFVHLKTLRGCCQLFVYCSALPLETRCPCLRRSYTSNSCFKPLKMKR